VVGHPLTVVRVEVIVIVVDVVVVGVVVLLRRGSVHVGAENHPKRW